MAAARAVLQTGKQNVGISGVEPVGNYALRLLFDDGHNTGLYSWSVLHELGRDHRSELGALSRALRRKPAKSSRGYRPLGYNASSISPVGYNAPDSEGAMS